jgi:hypothetical protein
MQTYNCTFNIPAGTQTTGGRLTGGFDSDLRPLVNGDQITVTVISPFSLAQLTGNFVFTALPPQQPGGPEAALPSPFTTQAGQGGHTVSGQVLCLHYTTIIGTATQFVFGPLTYNVADNTKSSRYELTFVAADNSQTPPVQWSEDPEFDTGG